MSSAIRLGLGLWLIVVMTACSPTFVTPGTVSVTPQLIPQAVVTADGVHLPLRSWVPETTPRAVIIAVHGFNDYSPFIKAAASQWVSAGLLTYAYDQRGFGDTTMRGRWAGYQAMVDDLKLVVRLLRERHPDLPIYLLGESMGGAVVMVTMTEVDAPQVAGVILAAPAVWARETMPWYQRMALWLTAHTMPGLMLTGKGLNITPSDNTEMLRALGRDPKVIKKTRVEALYGVTNLMDKAFERAAQFTTPAMLLYGEHDDIIPREPTYLMMQRLPKDAERHILYYSRGYHMLLRDLQAQIVWDDIQAWIDSEPFPSGADQLGARLIEHLSGSAS